MLSFVDRNFQNNMNENGHPDGVPVPPQIPEEGAGAPPVLENANPPDYVESLLRLERELRNEIKERERRTKYLLEEIQKKTEQNEFLKAVIEEAQSILLDGVHIELK